MSHDNMGGRRGTDRRTVLKTMGAGATVTSMTALAGCLGFFGGDETEGLTIGHIGPEANVLGAGSLRTAEMAVEAVNDNGGVMDQDVTLETGDTQADPSEAQTIVEELITEEDVDVLVGGFASEVARQVIELTAEFDVPYLSTGPADHRLTSNFVGDDYDEYKHYFRIGPVNSDFQAQALRDYAVHLSDLHGWNSLTFYRDNAAWTEYFGNNLPDMIEDEGLTVEEQAALTIEGPDLSRIINSTTEANADFTMRFFAHISNSPSELLGPWHEAGYEFGVEGIHVPGMHPEFDTLTQGACIYETTSQTGAGGATEITDHTGEFIDAYRSRYEDDDSPRGSPMYMGFATYDAILLLQEVVNDVGETDLANNVDGFVDEMLATEPGRVDTISGDLEFYDADAEYPHDVKEVRNDDGEIVNYPITQWQPNQEEERPGKFECVFPNQYETAEHMMPHWMA